MIIPQFKGRLGNQLFQAATAFSLAKRLNDKFAIDGTKPVDEIFKNFTIHASISPDELYEEPQFRYKPIELNNYDPSKTYILDGYFQSIKYFEEDLEEFIEKLYFTVNDRIQIQNILPSLGKYITIHSRRGDYFYHQDIHPVQTADYFINALEHFPKEYKRVVCTDDVNGFHREHAGKFDYVFSNGSAKIDLLLMANANGNILSNSSFSWWGNILNKNRKNITTVCPKEWFGPNGPDYTDLPLPEWIKL